MAASQFNIAQLPVRCEVALTNSNPHIVVEELLTVATEFHVQSGKLFTVATEFHVQSGKLLTVATEFHVQSGKFSPVITETQQILVFNRQTCTLYSVNDSLVRVP